MLILQGSNGERIGLPVEIELETKQIEDAWAALEHGIRKCVNRPYAFPVTRKNLKAHLESHRPHILWFSGHGRAKPEPGLLFADDEWVPVNHFADLVKLSGHSPLYAVFWACDTARAHTPNYPLPLIVEELVRVGVIAVLGMQSPIADSIARRLARDLFAFLATGLPLELALSRARAVQISVPPEDDAHRYDWASPVVWSNGSVSQRLRWNSPEQQLAQLQLLGRQAMRWRLPFPTQLEGPPTQNEMTQAGTWVASPRTWVVGNVEEAEDHFYWIRTLQAVQFASDWFLVAVDLKGANTESELRDWATAVYQRALPGDFPDSAIRLIHQMTTLPASGWKRLCNLPGVFLAVSAPPVDENPGWFWDPLLATRHDLRVAVLSKTPVPGSMAGSWTLDSVGGQRDEQLMRAAVERAPRLARALAVLNLPLGVSYIRVASGPNEGARVLAEWPERGNVLIETPAGPIVAATARQLILADMDAPALKTAHTDCVKMLGHPHLTLTDHIREHRLKHLIAAGLGLAALEEAVELCWLFREEDRPTGIRTVLDLLGPLKIDLTSSAKLRAAWAYVQLGSPEQGRYWLDRTQPISPLEIAWKHGLLAEIYKSDGTAYSKEHALSEIDTAIAACQNAATDPAQPSQLIRKRLRAYQQDRARILQFLFYQKEQAAEEYDRLIAEWNREPGTAIDLAVVKRNSAECLRTLATDPQDPRRQRARDLLNEAEALVASQIHAPILSEILYEQAKNADADGDVVAARSYVLRCQEAALNSNHYMMWAIARNRLFWKYETFSLMKWREVVADLQAFPHHGWALRTLVDGRLRAAHHLGASAELEIALAEIAAARGELARNPSFNRGRDRFRIAATFAGLQIISDKMGNISSSWETFRHDFEWATDWLAEQARADASAVWMEVR